MKYLIQDLNYINNYYGLKGFVPSKRIEVYHMYLNENSYIMMQYDRIRSFYVAVNSNMLTHYGIYLKDYYRVLLKAVISFKAIKVLEELYDV